MAGPMERDEFRALIRDKVVAVVGRAHSLIGQGHGREIDSADVVVRANHAEGIDPEHTGARTDVYYHKGSVMPRGLDCWWIVSDRDLRRRLSNKKRKYRTTTGVICLYECIAYAKEVRAYGFDLYQSHYIDGTPHKYVDGRATLTKRYHIIAKDRKHVRALLANPRFRPDPILRAALEAA